MEKEQRRHEVKTTTNYSNGTNYLFGTYETNNITTTNESNETNIYSGVAFFDLKVQSVALHS